MKHIFLAAAALIAGPALAQTTTTPAPSSADQTVPPAGQTTPDASGTTAAPATPPAADGSMATQTAPAQQPMTTQAAPTQQPMTTDGGDPVGGYQPSTPAISGPAQPGQAVTFQPAPSPDQAYPAPAPLASYPVCKPGQFDNCMQGRGSTHSRQVHRRSRR